MLTMQNFRGQNLVVISGVKSLAIHKLVIAIVKLSSFVLFCFAFFLIPLLILDGQVED